MESKLEIGIWSSTKNTLKDYQLLKECGVTHAFIDQNYSRRGTKEHTDILKLCEAVGLKAYVFNFNSAQAFMEDKTPYSDYTAFEGLHVWDEPSALSFDEIAAMIPEYEKRYPNATFYVNLYPQYVVHFDDEKDTEKIERLIKWFGVANYEDYLQAYCEKVLSKINGKRILSVDFYPLGIIPEENKIFLSVLWLRNLELVAKYAKAYQALPYFYIQSTSFGKWCREPKEADFSLQYFISLAYGVRGINHFTYSSPLGGEFAEKDIALVDRQFNPTKKWHYVKKLNERIQPLCAKLFEYEYQGTQALLGEGENEEHEVAAIGNLKENLTTLQRMKVCSTQRNLVVGEFVKKGQNKYAYLAVNFTDPYREEDSLVCFGFDKETTIEFEYKGQKQQIVSDMLEVVLESGEGIFIRIL